MEAEPMRRHVAAHRGQMPPMEPAKTLQEGHDLVVMHRLMELGLGYKSYLEIHLSYWPNSIAYNIVSV